MEVPLEELQQALARSLEAPLAEADYRKLAAALAVGNAVVFKPSPVVAAVGDLLVKIRKFLRFEKRGHSRMAAYRSRACLWPKSEVHHT